MCDEGDERSEGSHDHDPADDLNIFFAMLDGDWFNMRLGGPIGKYGDLVEQEPHMYRPACSSPSRDICADAMHQGFRDPVKNNTVVSAALPAREKPSTAKGSISGRPTTRGRI